MMKVLFLIPNLKHGGAEKVLVNLVNNLDRQRFDVTVLALFDEGIHKGGLQPHVHYRHFLGHQFRGNSYLFRCFSPLFWWKRVVKDAEYDVVISYLEGPTTRILSGCSDTSTKTIAWVHIELNTPTLAAQGFRSLREAQQAYRNFDRVVAVSQSVRDCFQQNIGIDLPITVVYNTNETGQIREKALLPAEDERFRVGDIPVICSVAKLMKTKGFDRLIEAHRWLLEEGLRHRVYILGIGEEEKCLARQIEACGVSDSFVLLGFKENPYPFVSRADLYVCSSRREGFSTAVTEALILGTPVVSTDCSGARELLGENDEYGLVVGNDTDGIYEGMKKMLENPALLRHYREQAKIRGCFFSKEKTVQAVQEMLEEL